MSQGPEEVPLSFDARDLAPLGMNRRRRQPSAVPLRTLHLLSASGWHCARPCAVTVLAPERAFERNENELMLIPCLYETGSRRDVVREPTVGYVADVDRTMMRLRFKRSRFGTQRRTNTLYVFENSS